MAKTVLDQLIERSQARRPTVAPSVPSVPTKTTGGVPRNNAVTLTAPSGAPTQQGDGFGPGDVFKFAGRQAMNVLNTLDLPRAGLASGLKELSDLVASTGVGKALKTVDAVTPGWADFLLPMPLRVGEKILSAGEAGDASLSEFREQTARRARGRELGFKDIVPGTELLPDAVSGFITDLAMDPLTYTPGVFAKQAVKIGVKGVARNASEAALLNAVKSGSSRQISETLATNALKAGVADSAGIQALIADSAIRGRGALTFRGLQRANVSADDAAKLGLRVEQPNVAIRTLQGAENIKGAVKQTFRTTEAAKGFRRAFVSERAGRRNLLNETLNKSLPVERRAKAVLAEVATDRSIAVARQWASQAMRSAELDMVGNRTAPGVWSNLSDEQGRAATRNMELGIAGEAEDVGSGIFNKFFDQLERQFGVQLRFRKNYVAHIFRDEFYDRVRKDERARTLFESVLSKESFQRERRLNAGDTFMDEVLREGTIDEINRIARNKLGVDVLYDDLRDIMPRYITRAEESVQRAVQIRQFQELGLGESLARKLVDRTDPDFVQAMEAAQAGYKAAKNDATVLLRNGTRVRYDLLKTIRGTFEKRQQQFQARIVDLEHQLNAQGSKIVGLQDELTTLESALANRQTYFDSLQAQMDAVVGNEKRRLQRELRKAQAQFGGAKKLEADKRRLEKQIADLRAQIDAAMNPKVTGPQTRLQRGAALARTKPLIQSVRSLQAELDALRNATRSIDEDYMFVMDAIRRGPVRFDEGAERLAEISPDLARLQESVLNASDMLDMVMTARNRVMAEKDVAETIYLFAAADVQFARNILDTNIANLDNALSELAAVTKLPRTVKDNAVNQANMFALRDKFDAVRNMLDRTDLSPEMQAVLKLEAAASQADLAAAKAANQVKLFEDMLETLAKDSQTEILDRASKGMVQVGTDLQIPEWLFNATRIEQIKREVPNIARWQQKYFNLFKGYAILRPGFHVRNLYSAMFGMYLDRGPKSFINVKRWHDFYTMATHNPEGYMVDAVKKFGQVEAERLDQVWQAIAGTGAGGGMAEFVGKSFRKPSKNPFDENNYALAMSRRAGGWVEDHVRGAHAYDVLRSGGTMEQAMDTVNRWQFNYVDVTDFDQKMKLINPFWVFFSRNMALQAQTWVKVAPKINRTFVNFERNMNYGLEEDGVVPEYFYTEGATRLPFKGVGGESLYWFSDLPALTFPGELDRMSDPTSARFAADLGPFLKIPVELIANRQLFSDIPIDTTRPERLPFGVGRLPGAGALGFLPGVDTAGSGELMANPEVLNAVMSAFPGLGQLQRLAPIGSEKGMERLPYTVGSYLTGIGLTENTPRVQQGELYRRNLALSDELKRQRRLLEA